MMSESITVEAKVLGRKRPLISDWSIPIPPITGADGRVTLRDLIGWTVRHEVAAFQERQEQRRLVRVLSKEDIERQLAHGKVDLGGQDLQHVIDTDAAIATAVQAFQDGIYFVFINDIQR